MKTDEITRAERNNADELKGIVLSCLGASCWGFSGTCVSYLVGHNAVDIPWLACTRLFVAGLLFLGLAFLRDRDKFAILLHDRGLIVRTLAYTLLAVVLMQISYMTSISLRWPCATVRSCRSQPSASSTTSGTATRSRSYDVW